MLTKKKIAISFFISGFIIAILVAFGFVSFIQLRKAITFLEITDTIRSKSLQVRRHEKNFFLYGSTRGDAEAKEVHRYLGELNGILLSDASAGMKGRLSSFRGLLREYERRFTTIEESLETLSSELKGLKTTSMKYSQFSPCSENGPSSIGAAAGGLFSHKGVSSPQGPQARFGTSGAGLRDRRTQENR